MKKLSGFKLFPCLLGAALLGPAASPSFAQNPPPPDHPKITFQGQTYTPRSVLTRNMGTEEDQTTAFPPHKIIGNIYYVGDPDPGLLPHRDAAGQYPHGQHL